MDFVYKGQRFRSLQELMDYALSHPEEVEGISAIVPNFKNMYEAYKNGLQDVQNGDFNSLYGHISGSGLELDGYGEKFVDNAIARENVAADQEYQTQSRDTSLLSAGSQLEKLGLSSTNVISTGGASSGVQSQPAAQNMHSTASLLQQKRINEYNQRLGLAKSIISMVGSMASSGIYGGALNAAKNTAGALASATAHSGYKALSALQKAHSGAGNGSLLSGKLAEEWSKLPGAY